jgi:acetylornithine/N-succinyldiaminopimelate aminotransferase
MMVAKGIGSGFPLGCVLATENAARGMSAGTHGSTYGGNPLFCAVANAVMDIIAQSDFLDEVERKGVLLKALLDDLVFKHSSVFELARGVGLMVGLKCKLPVGDVLSASYAQQLLAVPAGDNTLRLLPALTVTDLELEDAVARLDCAASSLSA